MDTNIEAHRARGLEALANRKAHRARALEALAPDMPGVADAPR